MNDPRKTGDTPAAAGVFAHFTLPRARGGAPEEPAASAAMGSASWDGSRRPKPLFAGSVHDSPAALGAGRPTFESVGWGSCSCGRGQAGCVIVYSGKGQMMTVASTDDPILKRFKAALVNMTALAVVDANSREAPNRS
jgi:hypothetical protein